MSHFTVLVIGENPEEQLIPYQENNTENCPQKYLTFHNAEEENKLEYETGEINVDEIYHNSIRISEEDYNNIIHNENATLHIKDPLDIISFNLNRYRLYKFFSESNYENRLVAEVLTLDMISRDHAVVTVKHFPDVRKVKIKDEMTWDEYMSDYCGYKYNKNKNAYGFWVNENAKWDWYQLGGRWNGFFQLKQADVIPESTGASLFQLVNNFGFSENEMATFVYFYKNNQEKFDKIISKYGEKGEEIRNFIKNLPSYVTSDDIALAYRKGILGADGVFGPSRNSFTGRADQARKNDIDFDSMINQAKEKAKNEYELVERFYDGSIPEIKYKWNDLLNSSEFSHMSTDDKRKIYMNQKPIRKKIDLSDELYPTFSKYDLDFIRFMKFEDFLIPKSEYVEKSGNKALSTFAVIKDGEWYEKGEMGWFAAVIDAKDQDYWNDIVMQLIDEASDDDLFSLYDCHI